jgi:hypothetical protein
MAYGSSRRIHWYSSANNRLGQGGRQGERYEDRVQAWGGRLAGVPAVDGDGAGVRPQGCGRHAEAVAVKALRSDGQLVPSSVVALGERKGTFGLGRSARNWLGCQPSGWRSCPRPTRLRTRQ